MKTTISKKINSSRRFLSPTLTLSAAALSASAAHGAVVVTDFADLTASSSAYVFLSFNPTTGSATASTTQPGDIPSWRFNASSYFDFAGKSGWTSAQAVATWSPQTSLAATPLLPGSTIDNTISWVNQIFPVPGNLTDAYFGVRLLADIETSNYQYGWVKISTGPNTGGNGATSITVKAAALETTPNTAITIVPEPSSALLLGLAAGVGAFRRRRSQAA